MSWSEIKKAVNSNLNVPLDKKIDKVLNSECMWIYQSGTLSGGEKTILSVNGSGYLHEVLYKPATKDSSFSLYVDDKLFLRERNLNNYTNTAYDLVLFNNCTSSYYHSTVNNSEYIKILLPKSSASFGIRQFSVTSKGDFKRAKATGYIEVDSSTINNTTDTYTFVVLPFPIRFEKSLRIVYNGGTGSTTPVICANYSVD